MRISDWSSDVCSSYLGAGDALEALGDHGLDAQQDRALGRPVARRAGAVFLAGQDHQRRAVGLVLHRRVVDRQLFAGAVALAEVLREAAFHAVERLVADAAVGEGAAHPHLVVAAAPAVAVELGSLHAARPHALYRRSPVVAVSHRRASAGAHRSTTT